MPLAQRSTRLPRVIAIAAVVAVLAVVGSFAVRGIRASAERESALKWERHTGTVLLETERLNARLRGAEATQRGFLLTADPTFRPKVRAEMAAARAHLAAIRRLTADNPRQQRNVADLTRLVEMRLKVIAHVGEVAAATGAVDIPAIVGGTRLMEQVVARLAQVRAEEERLLTDRRAASTEAERATDRANVWLGIIGLALVAAAASFGLAAWAASGRSRVEAARAAALAESRAVLEARVDERTEELRAANAKLLAEAQTREEAEAQVRQMQKMESIGQLTGGIAHDFNNMLAIVIGSLDMAGRRLDADPQRARTYIANAEEGARRAAQLTARLLAFSRQQPLAPEALDVNKLVGETSELIRRTVGEQYRIETVLAGGLWRSFADKSQLENAILNLAVNARDAMGDNGKITLETSNTHLDEAYAAAHAEVKPGQYVVICVTDTGTGMPAHVIERAFDPFFTTKGVGKGTGLGLSQVFGFVKQSGGHVKIYSEEGVGTTIKLYLPRWFGEDGPARASATAPGTEVPRARGDEIILVVEDEQRVRHLSVDSLRELGYTVVQANDGEAALEQLGVQPRIDLLFTDIVMPGLNGRQLADRARAMRPGLRVLFTTGYTRNAVVHNGMVDPGVSLLSKPFSLRDLATRVRAILDTPA